MNNLISLNEIIKESKINEDDLQKFLIDNEIKVFKYNDVDFVLEENGPAVISYINENNNYTEEEKIYSTKGTYNLKNKLNNLTGSEWLPETKSFWYQKGLGRNHPHAQIEKLHPAPFSFQDISRLITFFTKENDVVLDPFLGVGSTIKAAELENRIGIGIELSNKWINLAKERLEVETGEGSSLKHTFLEGDSRVILKGLETESIDFIVTSPPYWSILNKKNDHKTIGRVEQNLATNYSDSENDLGNIESYNDFLNILTNEIFLEAGRTLKVGKYMAIVVSDFRHESKFVSFHSDLIQRLDNSKIEERVQFKLQGVKVLLQNHKSLLPYGYPYAYVENIHHQYIIIFRKTKVPKNVRV